MYEKFDIFVEKLLNSLICTILVVVIGATLSGTFLYNHLDFQYATKEDYEPLYRVQSSIINDFSTVYSFSNVDIDITTSNIIVYIYGEDCYLELYFDKTNKYLNSIERDNTDPIWFSILMFVVMTFVGCMSFYLMYILLLLVINFLIYKISLYLDRKEL